MLLLPSSLRNLCKSFNVLSEKGYFPFKFNNIYYKGSFPKFEYFNDISIEQHTLLSKEFLLTEWNFKEEAIKYCKLDCKTLHEILTKFNELIFNNWNINIHEILTVPSLAMRLFKTHYLPKDSVYQLHSSVERAIRRSYTGGAVDVYIPHNHRNETLFVYDVNSLYPSQMAKFNMPVGKPIIFEGDIRKVDPNAFGFFYCKIESPHGLNHPILQNRIKTKSGIRTVAGLGYWEGWIFSKEMDNALKYGYQFEILKGYQFNEANIFKDYINDLYNLRLKYDKSDPMNMIAKLLMNSLYGKFGMKDEIVKLEILENVTDDDKSFVSAKLEYYGPDIIDMIELDNHILITYKQSSTYLYYNEKDEYLQIIVF
jgi:hypothetical protein